MALEQYKHKVRPGFSYNQLASVKKSFSGFKGTISRLRNEMIGMQSTGESASAQLFEMEHKYMNETDYLFLS